MYYKYLVVDIYDGQFVKLGNANTLAEVKEIAKEQEEATDGECWCFYYEINPHSGKYSKLTMKAV